MIKIEDENVIVFPDLWFEKAPAIEETNKLSVQLNAKKAISDQNISSNSSDEKFVFSLELIEKLKKEFSGEERNKKGIF